ncbi:TPA: class IIb bacteriocin, lactobin A/cerein 7B family [Streptococcus suis]
MEIQSLKFEQLSETETELTNIDGGVAPALIAFGVAAAKGFGGTVAVAGGVMTLHSFGRFLSGR